MKTIGKIRTVPIVKEGQRPDGAKWRLVIYDIDRVNYSTFNEDFQTLKMGDDIEIDYVKSEDGKYNDIKTVKRNFEVKDKELEGFKPAVEHMKELVDVQRIIVRQNALTQANYLIRSCYDKLMVDQQDPAGVLKDIARILEDWVFRE